ncbi:MAG: efflux RND transporter periplasmic adaptor subunit [Pseudomonadales bacterium]|nr:efflux RND transporter periplasmic adaptor subunit [Pseudomonadales bacterium]
MSISKSRKMMLVVTLVLLTGLGLWRFYPQHTNANTKNTTEQTPNEPKILYWYDPMVPEQKFDKGGKSPFMDMQLVPKYADSVNTSGVSVSAAVAQNLGIRVVKAKLTEFSDGLSAVGRVEVDEYRVYAVQTRSAGFVEHLAVRAVGDTVRAGQKVADIYAPELLAAQQEYLALLKVKGIADIDILRQAARQRLQLLGMASQEITTISKTGQANPRIGVYAPASGVVTELLVREGGQVLPSSNLMQLADLSRVWLLLDIPENDVSRLKIGDEVEAKFDGLAEECFTGRIDYIYPMLERSTRSMQVRVVLANSKGILKTGMFANASLVGQRREVISIPSEAVISTGTRTVVIIKEGQRFRPAEVRLGAEKNGRSEILQGLAVGEEVVASGQFLIDSEASLNGVLARLASDATTDMDTDMDMDMEMSHD